jgi:NitT/TauT family transport system substrate-binding protein
MVAKSVSRREALLGGVALSTTLAAPAFGQAAKVKVGINYNAADLPYFIAQEMGLFRDENLDVELINFKSTTEMMAPLGTGGLDVGGGGLTAALYNAVGRGLAVRLVADKASAISVEYSPLMLLVRQALIDNGSVKTVADLKGRKFGNISPGGGGESLVNELMKQEGLGFADVESVYLPPPQLAVAFENGAIDATLMTEPFSTILMKKGVAKLWAPCGEVYPGMQVAAIYYGKSLLENREIGQRFMNAYVRASRIYVDSLGGGKFKGELGQRIVEILAKYTAQKDIQLILDATPHGLNPDGAVLMPAIRKDYAFFKSRGLIEVNVPPEAVIDNTFAEASLKKLGPYKKSG